MYHSNADHGQRTMSLASCFLNKWMQKAAVCAADPSGGSVKSQWAGRGCAVSMYSRRCRTISTLQHAVAPQEWAAIRGRLQQGVPPSIDAQRRTGVQAAAYTRKGLRVTDGTPLVRLADGMPPAGVPIRRHPSMTRPGAARGQENNRLRCRPCGPRM